MYMNMILVGSHVNNNGKTNSMETNTFRPGMMPEITPRPEPTKNAKINSNIYYDCNIPSDIQSTF